MTFFFLFFFSTTISLKTEPPPPARQDTPRDLFLTLRLRGELGPSPGDGGAWPSDSPFRRVALVTVADDTLPCLSPSRPFYLASYVPSLFYTPNLKSDFDRHFYSRTLGRHPSSWQFGSHISPLLAFFFFLFSGLFGCVNVEKNVESKYKKGMRE